MDNASSIKVHRFDGSHRSKVVCVPSKCLCGKGLRALVQRPANKGVREKYFAIGGGTISILLAIFRKLFSLAVNFDEPVSR
jgi:hypothetical protein